MSRSPPGSRASGAWPRPWSTSCSRRGLDARPRSPTRRRRPRRRTPLTEPESHTRVLSARLALAAAFLCAAPATAVADSAGFTNPVQISVRSQGKADPYPSQINVQGVAGQVTEVSVSLNGINHPRPEDVDILLESPGGKTSILMSDACGATTVVRVAWIFSRTASLMSGSCSGLIYRPTNEFGESDYWPNAKGVLWSPDFNHFLGASPNGTWRLWVIDDRSGPSQVGGLISGGWALQLTTEPADLTVPAATGRYDGQADRYPTTRTVGGLDGVIADVDAFLDGVYRLTVSAGDEAGNASAPVTRSFTVR
jgi:subtilisin-like proprotein convertase family protein